jgi:hypothetical protein
MATGRLWLIYGFRNSPARDQIWDLSHSNPQAAGNPSEYRIAAECQLQAGIFAAAKFDANRWQNSKSGVVLDQRPRPIIQRAMLEMPGDQTDFLLGNYAYNTSVWGNFPRLL